MHMGLSTKKSRHFTHNEAQKYGNALPGEHLPKCLNKIIV